MNRFASGPAARDSGRSPRLECRQVLLEKSAVAPAGIELGGRPDNGVGKAQIHRYLGICQAYQVKPCPDIVTWLRLRQPSLRVFRPRGVEPFRDLDLQPLSDLLEEADSLGSFPALTELNLSGAKLGPSGAALAAHLLGLPQCRVECLDLSWNLIGPDGARVVAEAARCSPSLRTLRVRGCLFGDAGASGFVDLLEDAAEADADGDDDDEEDNCAVLRRTCCLEELDLQNNIISYEVCRRLEQGVEGRGTKLLLLGNRVMDEIMNAVSHLLGLVLSIIGSVFLGIAVQHKPTNAKVAVVIYCIALHVQFLSSVLMHSLFALGPLVYSIFETLDHCAIYLMIAGSYGPILALLFSGEPRATYLMCFLWLSALCGVFVSACCSNGTRKTAAELTLYLGMGWACMTLIVDLIARLGPEGGFLFSIGGLAYTFGVPFFVKDDRTLGFPDHCIWHCFVLAGSICHYFCVLLYCLPYKPSIPA